GGGRCASHCSPSLATCCQRLGALVMPTSCKYHSGSENAKSRPITVPGSFSSASSRWSPSCWRVRPFSKRSRSFSGVASASQMRRSAPTLAPDQSTARQRMVESYTLRVSTAVQHGGWTYCLYKRAWCVVRGACAGKRQALRGGNAWLGILSYGLQETGVLDRSGLTHSGPRLVSARGRLIMASGPALCSPLKGVTGVA